MFFSLEASGWLGQAEDFRMEPWAWKVILSSLFTNPGMSQAARLEILFHNILEILETANTNCSMSF